MIKKRYKTEYYYVGNDLWVRDFTKETLYQIDINDLTPIADMQLMLENEIQNKTIIRQAIESEHLEWPTVAIIGDGFNFAVKQKILDRLAPEVILIGVNNAMNLWSVQRRLNFYVINNPFQEAIRYLPKRPQPRPRIIASQRTNPEFLKKYNGIVYHYTPTPSEKFSTKTESKWLIDDYRNPICAAICLAFKFNAKKLLLFCCDSSFRDERPGAEKLPNGLWMYPQQNTANRLIDGCLHWLTQQVEVRNHSSGPEWMNANYISESDIPKFMRKDD